MKTFSNKLSCILFLFCTTGASIQAMKMLLHPSKASTQEQDNALFALAETGSLDRLNSLLERGSVNIDVRNSTGGTPLHVAAFNGHAKFCERLLNAGASVNVENMYGNTPLHNAVLKGDKPTCEILRQYGADVNRVNKHHKTPLEIAQDTQRSDIHEALTIETRKSLQLKDVFTLGAMAAALVYPIVKRNSSAEEDESQRAQSRNHPNRPKVQPTVKHQFPTAAQLSTFDSIKGTNRLIKQPFFSKYPNPLVCDLDALCTEVALHRDATARRWQGDINKILAEIASGKYFLDQPGSDGVTALIFACAGGDIYARNPTIPVDFRDHDSTSPEFRDEMLKIALLLLSKGVTRVNIIDKTGNSALMYLVRQRLKNNENRIKVLKALLEKGARVDYINRLGNTALFLSTMDDPEVLRILIAAGAAINQEGMFPSGNQLENPVHHLNYNHRYGSVRIPFFNACESWSDPECRRILYESGANVNALFSENCESVLTYCALVPHHYYKDALDIKTIYSHTWGTPAGEESLEAYNYCIQMAESIYPERSATLIQMIPLVDNIDHRNKSSQTALSIVCEWQPSNIQVIQLLLKHGADATLVNKTVFLSMDEKGKMVLEQSNPRGITATFGSAEKQQSDKRIIDVKNTREAIMQRAAATIEEFRKYKVSMRFRAESAKVADSYPRSGGSANNQNTDRVVNAVSGPLANALGSALTTFFG